MRRGLFVGWSLIVVTGAARAEPALTIYNQNFAVVRDTLPLDLKPGLNRVEASDITSALEPDSVILRDPKGVRQLQVVEQNYRTDAISQSRMLSLYEGKTVSFRVTRGDTTEIIKGKVIRSGYVPGPAGSRATAGSQPVIEVDGEIRFSLPGEPIFPALPSDALLKPTLSWLLRTDAAGPLNAELAYVTGGLSWKADYNVIAPENSDVLELIGWVTLTNSSGKSFENATVKLMAGDVSKVYLRGDGVVFTDSISTGIGGSMSPPRTVTQKSFDDYHLYALTERTTVRDRETKQVEMLRAQGVKSERVYVYDGVQIDRNRYDRWNYENIRQEQNYGTQSNPKVWVMREFLNTTANNLGMPLPQGRMRFYRRDGNGALEFAGESNIDHKPQGETVRVYTGNAFDIVGERRRVSYKIDYQQKFVDESFEIKLRNRKTEPVSVRILEHLYREANWSITEKSDAFIKTEANTAEVRVTVPPNEEKSVTYMVRYTW